MNYFNQAVIICICIFFLIPKIEAQNIVEKKPFEINQIEQKIDRLLKNYNFKKPGLAIGVVYKDNLVIQKQYGLANVEHQIPITKKTSFHVASVSKQFTAFALFQLEDEGKLSLEDDIRKYLPEMNEFDFKITIKHLLNHTSGIKDQWNLLRLGGWRLNDFITNSQVLEILFNQKSLNFKPNEDFMYSNSGYTLLAEIVSRVSGKSFSDYTKKHIFNPLKMYNTQFIDTEGQIIKNKSYSYYKEGSYFIEDVFNNISIGATNLSTTIEDLSKWAINFNEKNIGNGEVFQKMNRLEKLNNGSFYGYANGQFINEYRGLKRIEHSGQDASYIAYLGRFPNQGISIIFTSNSSEINGSQLVRQITDICLNEYFPKKQANNNISNKSLISKKPIKKSLEELKSFEGYYWNEKDDYSRQIKLQNNTLQYIRNKTDKTALIPVDDNEFEMKIDEYVSVLFNPEQVIVTLDDGEKIFLDKYIPANYSSNSLKEFEGNYYSTELNSYYTFFIQNDTLIANHQRLGDFKMKAIKNDYFIGNKGSFQKVKFVRNDLDEILGFKVSSSRAKNVSFNKIIE
ncbi:serine hydrolase domain-containing protein [Winogradskyella immobilis]|uniref:Beta-lactamase family protein n=1 Tax=Winogradskyella immobilis TaxID=2816852 RepID=A0ABS8EL12_9FLAO|nr:serine hydrolase domain-containing protein [Winogradskyella immobilis]MCC1483260.1 beta-lactamase family protein [Winogradskyella immobilis]MCG0015354.1 beta-lactamase family protein [Winogradskyella immobilis]